MHIIFKDKFNVIFFVGFPLHLSPYFNLILFVVTTILCVYIIRNQGFKMTSTKRSKKNADRLSSLPQEVLVYILSLMPTLFAVRTSILSKKWKYNWMLVNKLDLDTIHSVRNKARLIEFVDRVLTLCKTPKVEVIRLNISKWTVPAPTVSKWITHAIKLNVSELDIQVRKLDLPLSLFTCKTLTKFRLNFGANSTRYKALWGCPSEVNLPCLKTLDIVVYSEPFENAFKLIDGCPVLENLSLNITRRDTAENYRFNIPTLKRLTLSFYSTVALINDVVLNVPNLEYLCIDANTLTSRFVMRDLSSLVEAKVSCGVKDDHLWDQLMKGISRAKYLYSYMMYWLPFISPLNIHLPEFPNMKRLELTGYVGTVSLLIPQILESCSELEHLSVNQPQGFRWNEALQPVPNCMLTKLKTIIVRNIWARGEEYDIHFIKFMLANSKVLKMFMVMFHDSVPLNREGALSREISMIPRASMDCEIRFDGKWPHSTTPWCF